MSFVLYCVGFWCEYSFLFIVYYIIACNSLYHRHVPSRSSLGGHSLPISIDKLVVTCLSCDIGSEWEFRPLAAGAVTTPNSKSHDYHVTSVVNADVFVPM